MFAHSYGFVLIELMLALGVALLLISALLEIYVAATHCYQQQAALNSSEADAETVLTLLKNDIHKAGHIGCAQLTNDFFISTPPYRLTTETKLLATNNQSLTVSYMDSPPALITAMPQKDQLQILGETTMKPGQWVVITDCTQAEMAIIKTVINIQGGAIIVMTKPLQHFYKPNSEVGLFIQHTYFIAKSHLPHPLEKEVYALFEQDLQGKNEEWVTGISDMTFSFSTKNKDNWVDLPADQMVDWSQVKGVALAFTTNNLFYSKRWFGYVDLYD